MTAPRSSFSRSRSRRWRAGLSMVDAGISLVVIVVVSTVIGIAAGWLAGRVIATTDDHLVELIITLVLAYGTYVLRRRDPHVGHHHDRRGCDHVRHERPRRSRDRSRHGSHRHGLGVRRLPDDSRAVRCSSAWSSTSALWSALHFPLHGASLAVVGSRALIVYGMIGGASRLFRTRDRRIPTGWLHVMIAAGMRGAVSVALALSLPATVAAA